MLYANNYFVPELRNRIYGYVSVSSGPIRLQPAEKIKSNAAKKIESDGSNHSNSPPAVTNVLALTQVSKLLRMESKPLLMSVLTIQISAKDISAYIMHMNGCNLRSIPQKLELHLPPDDVDDDGEAYDIVPLLSLRKYRSDFEFVFVLIQPSYFCDSSYLDNLNLMFNNISPLTQAVDSGLITGVRLHFLAVQRIEEEFMVSPHLYFKLPYFVGEEGEDVEELAYKRLEEYGVSPEYCIRYGEEETAGRFYIKVFR